MGLRKLPIKLFLRQINTVVHAGLHKTGFYISVLYQVLFGFIQYENEVHQFRVYLLVVL